MASLYEAIISYIRFIGKFTKEFLRNSTILWLRGREKTRHKRHLLGTTQTLFKMQSSKSLHNNGLELLCLAGGCVGIRWDGGV